MPGKCTAFVRRARAPRVGGPLGGLAHQHWVLTLPTDSVINLDLVRTARNHEAILPGRHTHHPKMPALIPVPSDSFLDAYARGVAFTDCYAVTVSGSVSLAALIEAFYTSRLFRFERCLLDIVLGLQSTDEQARRLADGSTKTFSAWRVESRCAAQILLAAWQTRSWLGVVSNEQGDQTTLLFGSAVIPTRLDGKFGFVFHAAGGFHRLYSMLLLSAARRRVTAAARSSQSAALSLPDVPKQE